jgi:hypothetical protein
MHIFEAVHNMTWRDSAGRSHKSTSSTCLSVSPKAALLQWHLMPPCAALMEVTLGALAGAKVPPSHTLQHALLRILEVRIV